MPTSNTQQFSQSEQNTQDLQNAEQDNQGVSHLQIGAKLGHFIIDDYIGGGGMGKVYLATDSALDRKVAIKTLSQQRSGNQSAVSRFLNEARSAARLNDEHIAQVFFAGEEDGLPYIAFEYIEGTNVRKLIEEHDALSLPLALNYIVQISHALNHANEHGVIHRDVKPSNILITKEGKAKLIDMGLARLLDPSESQNDLTASGVTLGTFDYISPEQARDPRDADIRSDIYSLGCTFFFMLAGRPPFPEGTVLQKLLQHQGDSPPDIRSFQPDIPAEIAMIIQRMMAKSPKQRYQTPTALIDALLVAARNLGLRTTNRGNLVWSNPISARSRFLHKHLPWITAVLFLIAGFASMSLVSEWSPPLVSPKLPDVTGDADNININVLDNAAQQTGQSGQSDKPAAQAKETRTSKSFSVGASKFAPTRNKSNTPLYLGTNYQGFTLRPAPLHYTNQRLAAYSLSAASIPARSMEQQPQDKDLPNRVKMLCVDPVGETPDSYRTLETALAEIDNETPTVIELKWNGVQNMSELVILSQKKISLVGAENFSPILAFEPKSDSVISNSAAAFFTLNGGEFNVKGVALKLQIDPREPAWQHSLFVLSGDAKLNVSQSCLTIAKKTVFERTPTDWGMTDRAALETAENRGNAADIAFFRCGTFANDIESFMPPSPLANTPAITITDSLIRGEAAGLCCDTSQNVEWTITDSLVALSKSLIQTVSGRYSLNIESIERRNNNTEPTVKLTANHIFVRCRQELVTIRRDSQNAKPALIEFNSQRSVYALQQSPFAVFLGAFSKPDTHTVLRWTGKYNYFQNIQDLEKRQPDSAADDVTEKIPIRDWLAKSEPPDERRTKINALTVRAVSKPFPSVIPSDFILPSDTEDGVSAPKLDFFPQSW